MDSYYYRPEGVPGAPTLDPANSRYLDSLGQTQLLVPHRLVPGAAQTPSLYFQGDERTGLYHHGEGQVGLSIFGWTTLVYTTTDVEVWREGFKVGTLAVTTPSRNLDGGRPEEAPAAAVVAADVEASYYSGALGGGGVFDELNPVSLDGGAPSERLFGAPVGGCFPLVVLQPPTYYDGGQI